ncbi:hypothetical protein [Dysgonomonas sp. ZJ709]|uniref:hypothetical protein n=1 Tax=Dysgonomonas sp. ZJ709 TaxID=2709797 RepID=UPI0013ECE786|nr:hypothetical protein [Dysgonomonas sp. ZJ709]
MRYSDFIALQEYFHPIFNLQNEAAGYWKQFIPTMQFYNLLGKTVDAVSSNQPSNRKSIWVKGTFGTGKSHAGSVVKHLLCNDVNEISDYIEDRILLTELKSRLWHLRKNKHFFPVVLKGTEDGKIYDMRSFLLALERIIKDSLSNSGNSITVQSDFERAVEYLKSTPIDISQIIANEPELRGCAKSKEEIIKKMQASDTDTYLALEEALAKPQYSVHFSSSDIVRWLSEVEKEIVNKGIADGLLIIWDEFTSVMDTITSGMTNMIQNIAELTESQNIYLYLISHKNSNAYNNEDIRRMEDRFHIIQYNMEALTTYRIMAASIRKLDETQYDLYRDNRMDNHSELITYLTENDSQQSIKDIKDLFPFHPYAAYLCSSIANQIGSANRTVMQFMYDVQSGFLGFLNNDNTCDNKLLLTADKLWDYFFEEFQNDPEKYGIVNQTFYTHKKVVEDKGRAFEKVFKGILLLNAMRNKIGESDKIIPSVKNIEYLFEGENFEITLDEILDYFHRNQIIQRDPSDNFLIAFSALPVNEINDAINRVRSNFSDTKKILEFDLQLRDSINKIFEKSLIRQPALAYSACSSDAYLVRSYMKSAFKEPYTLNIALFFAMDITERQTMAGIVENLSITDDFKNIVFLMFDEVFDYDGMQKSSFYEYVATAQVAKSHNLTQPANANDINAKKVITNWINRLKQGTAKIYYRGVQDTINTNTLTQYINNNIVHKIFSNGVETLSSLRKSPMTFWDAFKSPSKTSIETMLVAPNRDEAEQKFKGPYTPAKLLFKDDNDDYIVDSDLVLKSNASDNHPLVYMQKKVDEILENTKQNGGSTFSLGAVLQPLTQPPFGLYTNIPNMAVLAFALRKYVNELNGTDSVPVDNTNMRDKVVEVFNYWQKGGNDNKLRVRFGSKEEKDLKDLLIGIFDMKRLSDVPELTSLINVRWGVVAYCTQKSKYPLWCLKYSPSVSTDDFRLLIEQIVELIQKDTLQPELINKILQSIRIQSFEFQRILLNDTAFEEGFKTFIQKIESISIEHSWWNELKEYLNQKLQSEIGRWQESDVEKMTMSFYIEKTRKPELQPILNPQPTPTSVPQPASSQILVDKISRVKEKVSRASNFSPIILKNILLQVLEEYPQTADIIDENLE